MINKCLFVCSLLAVLVPGSVFSQCGTSPSSGTTSISAASTIVNSYYPGTGNPAAGSTSLVVGTIDGRGNATALAAGDLVMIIQMQGADINSSNSNSYGDGVAGAPGNGYLSTALYAGRYEYNNVSSVSGTTINFSYSLANGYFTQSFTASLPIRSYQVIRVPRYYDLTIATSSSVTAPAWNGATGGVVVLDAANTLTFTASTSTVTVAGKGFRGGGGKNFTSSSGSLTNTDYTFNSAVTTAANSAGGAKGEGIAGTPVYVFNSGNTVTTTGTLEGYISGSMGRGAPGNAGGGATDGQPSTNQYNTGGGGGSNGGAGGKGGSGWDGTGGNPNTYPTGGEGGAAFTQGSLSTIIMGGGGGAGSANNSTTAQEYFCSGAAGGGIIFMRANLYAGNGSVIADGASATDITASGQTDAAGGAGAGGTIVLVTRQAGATGLGSITASANGGKGANMTTYYSHGPGGGGGGGLIITNGTLAAATVAGGANGTTHTCCSTTNPLTDSYGSTAGAAGKLIILSGPPKPYNPSSALSPCGLLPILLSDFRATLSGNTVQLSWSATNPSGFNNFTVEKSNDGLHFYTAGTVAFQNGITAYTFTDNAAVEPQYWYRLRLNDVDRNYSYSTVLAVRLTGNRLASITVYPNPFRHSVTLRVNAATRQSAQVRISDNTGKILFSRPTDLQAGLNFFSLPALDRFPAGLYYLRIVVDGSTQVLKLLRE